MIEKTQVITKTEVWRSKNKSHRYVFRRQWENVLPKGTKSKAESLAAVITIQPTDTDPYVSDLTVLLQSF